jgi:hypothetical protein
VDERIVCGFSGTVSIMILMVLLTFGTTILNSETSRFPLSIYDTVITYTNEGYVLGLTVFNNNTKYCTVYHCVLELIYLTEQNAWNVTSEDLGTMQYKALKHVEVLLENFKTNNSTPILDRSWHVDNGPYLQMNVYGYLKP